MMQERRNLGERLLEYGARIIKLVECLPNTLVGRRVADQLLRSGTSAGANYEEARAAESKDDFVYLTCSSPFTFACCLLRFDF